MMRMLALCCSLIAGISTAQAQQNYACPHGFPLDCGDQHCCPADHPLRCVNPGELIKTPDPHGVDCINPTKISEETLGALRRNCHPLLKCH